jgi:hypothetical protein
VSHLHIVGRTLAIAFSILFAVLLFPAIVDQHGVFKSLVYTGLGIAVIWVAYFLLGNLFKHLYKGGHKKGQEDNSDFV